VSSGVGVVIVVYEALSILVVAARIAGPVLSSWFHAVFSIENENAAV
jgi:hypothetical protein